MKEVIESFKRIWMVFKIRNREFYRDKGALGWVFLFPILIIIAFGYMFNLGEQGQFKVGHYSINTPPEVRLIEWVKYSDKEEALNKLRNQQVEMVVDTSQKPFQYWVAKDNPKSFLAEKLWLAEFSQLNPDAPTKNEIIGRKTKYIDWLFPGLVTMNVMWMALWGVGWVVVRQRRIGVLKRFKASPMRPHEYLLGQMLSRLVVLLVSGFILFAGSHLIYPFQTIGSYFDILIMYVAGIFALSSIGLIIAARLSSEEFANGLLNLLTYPMMFLSEIWFTLEGSSEWVKTIAKLSPLWHMTSGIRRIMNEGHTLSDMTGSFLTLIGIAIVFTTIGSFMFRWTKD